MARLEDIAQVLGGGTPSRTELSYFGGDIAWATPTDITKLEQLYIGKTKETISEEGLRNSSSKLMPAGSVLLTSRATIGFTAISTVPICTNQGFINFICGSELVPEYLAYWLRTQRSKMIQHAGGTTFKEIARGTLRKFEIPLPPLPEQRRIVDLLSRAEGIVRLRREAEEKTAELIPALFIDIFGDPARNPKGWEIVTIGDICAPTRTTIKPGERADLKYIGLESIESKSGKLLYGSLSKTPENPQANSFKFDERHVLYGKLRPYLNKVALPEFEGKCSTEIAPLLVNEKSNRSFLSSTLRSREFVEAINARSTGARMPRADMSFILSKKIPLPPIKLQNLYAERLLNITGLQSQQSTATEKAQAAFEALLAGVFKG